MAGHRRKWLIAVALLAIVAVLAWAWLGRGGKMEVQLAFVGYTNHFYAASIDVMAAQMYPLGDRRALVLVTNSGSVSVRLVAGMIGRNDVQAPSAAEWVGGFPTGSAKGLPQVLAPGKAVLLEVVLNMREERWWALVRAQRYGLRDRMSPRVERISIGWMQGLLGGLLPPPPETWAGPITNPPPRTPSQERLPSPGSPIP